MIILTDTPDWADQLCHTWGDHTAWEARDQAQLSSGEQGLWQALGNGPQLSRCVVSMTGPAAFWDYLVIIDEAAESQFDVLQTLDVEALPGQVACVAAQGRGFHGHRKRSWQTLRGNLHLSALCDPDLEAATCGLAMTTLPAVAVLDSLLQRGHWQSEPGIKWVNDILMDGRKVAGVLTATQSFRGRLSALTVGIGLNVEQCPQVAPSVFVPAVGCLTDASATSEPVTVGQMLFECLAALSTRLQSVRQTGPTPLIDAYRNASIVLGRQVALWPDGVAETPDGVPVSPPEAQGVVTAIGRDLSLTLDSQTDSIHQGRLAFIQT